MMPSGAITTVGAPVTAAMQYSATTAAVAVRPTCL
jgi:hypothetical protein